MKKNFTLLFLVLCLIGISNFLQAQPCVTIVVNTVLVTNANCPSSGNITVNATGTTLSYRLTSGPTGYSTAANSTGIFNSLVAGNYIIEIKDECNNVVTVTQSVLNNYPAFSVVSAATSNICTSAVQGGTITATVTGGSAPYQYDAVLVGNSPTYGAATGSTSYTKTVSMFGTYRVYVKDACGEVRTWDVLVLPIRPTPVELFWDELIPDRPCGETIGGTPTITWSLHFIDANGTRISFFNLIGSTWEVYRPNPANSITSSEVGGDCTTSAGALLNSGTVVASGIPASDSLGYPITIPQEDVILIFTTPCGFVFKYCYDFNNGLPLVPSATINLVQHACSGSGWSSQTFDIVLNYVTNLKAPISYTLTKNGGATITNSNGNFNNILATELPASMTIVDACGITLTYNFLLPVQGSALLAVAEPEFVLSCSNIRNTSTADIRIIGGDLPGISQATNVMITGGTPTAIPTLSPFMKWLPGYRASNLLSGFTYKISITNLCGEKDSIIFTVPKDQWGQKILDWNLTATTDALCGQNIGTITANANYTGYNFVDYYLYNLIAPNTLVASNRTGEFQSVIPGNYKVKFIVFSTDSYCPSLEIKDSVNVTVIADGTGQSINNRSISTCESGGVELGTGKAIVDVNGSAPFSYEIIKTSLVGTGPSEIWTTSSTNNPSSNYAWTIPMAGDPSNTVYTLRSTDKCGNKITTQASLQPVNLPNVESNKHPCLGEMDYTITAHRYAEGFTYRWVRTSDIATTLSTDNTLTFPGPYSILNNGIYRCYVSLPGCVDREVEVTINSSTCNQQLPVNLLSFSGSYKNGTALLKWVAENETKFSRYELERSSNANEYTKIETAYPKTAATANEYSAIDPLSNFTSSVAYYRLRMVDVDGRATYSQVVKINLSDSKGNLSIYPNPVQDVATLNFNSNSATTITANLLDQNGKKVHSEQIKVSAGNNTHSLKSLKHLPAGTYILEVVSDEITQRLKLLKL